MINKRDNSAEKFWAYAFLVIIVVAVIWGILTVIAAFFAGVAEGARGWGETIALGIDRIFFGIFKGIEWLVYLISALLGIVIMWFAGAFGAHFRNVVQSRSNYLTSEQLRLSLESAEPEHIRFVIETSKLPQPLIKDTVEAIDDFDDRIATHLEKFKKLMAEAVANKHHALPLAQKVRTLRDKITNDLQTFKLPDSIKRRAPRAYSHVLCKVTGEQIESLQYQPTIAALIPVKALELKQLPNTPLSNPKGSMMEKIKALLGQMEDLEKLLEKLGRIGNPGFGPGAPGFAAEKARELPLNDLIQILAERIGMSDEPPPNIHRVQSVVGLLSPDELVKTVADQLAGTRQINDPKLGRAFQELMEHMIRLCPAAEDDIREARRLEAWRQQEDAEARRILEEAEQLNQQKLRTIRELQEQGLSEAQINESVMLINARMDRLATQLESQPSRANVGASVALNPHFQETAVDPLHDLPKKIDEVPE